MACPHCLSTRCRMTSSTGLEIEMERTRISNYLRLIRPIFAPTEKRPSNNTESLSV